MPHNEFHPEASHMESRASKFSLAGANNPIGETMVTQEGTDAYNRGVTTGTTNMSPFNIGGDTSILQGPDDGDHLVYLLNENVDDRRDTASKTIACHAAIRAGQTLSLAEMQELIKLLEICKQPQTCAHGRPTVIHLNSNYLESQFGRR